MKRVRIRPALLFFAALFLSLPLFAKETWVEVRSPHFAVISNAGEKEARKIADQFEEFRTLFESNFPKFRVDLGKPLVIFTVRNEDSLKQLLPAFWETKGHIHPAGLYTPGEECHFVALRTDIEAENAYEVIYHEYTHALLNLNFRGVPVWLGEGLAEFYGNSVIHDNYAEIGKASASRLHVLQTERMIPIETLLEADSHSPYYNEQNRASIFYAESWAIVHYLMMDQQARKQQLLQKFLAAWDETGSQVEAAHQTFGDLKKFSDAMQGYAHQSMFYMGKVSTSIRGDAKSYSSRELPPAELAAQRSMFYVHTGRLKEAESAADEAVKEDPKQPLAYEAQGLVAFHEGRMGAASEAYQKAIELNTTDFYAYYFAARGRFPGGMAAGSGREQTIAWLEKSIARNGEFAPAYAALASVYSVNKDTHQKAVDAGLKAAKLDPGNPVYVMDLAYVLLNAGRLKEARTLAERLDKAAKSPEEKANAERVEQAIESRARFEEMAAESAERAKQGAARPSADKSAEIVKGRSETVIVEAEAPPPVKKHQGETEYASEGMVLSAECSSNARGVVALRVGNETMKFFYRKLGDVYAVSTVKEDAGKAPACAAWKGRRARLYFYKTGDKPYTGELDTIQFY